MPHFTGATAVAAEAAAGPEAAAAATAEAAKAEAATEAAAPERRAVFMDRQLQSEHLPWFKSVLQQAEPSAIRDSCSSQDDITSHPVMFVTQLDPTNPYHHTQVCVTLCSGLPLSTMLEGVFCTQ
jgi:hypothetical protein